MDIAAMQEAWRTILACAFKNVLNHLRVDADGLFFLKGG
jgi:hypothetical protein